MKPTIAVIGANSDRRKFANKCVRAYLAAGYDVFPVHPMETQVEGLTVFRSVADIPLERLDRVSVYLPPVVGVKAMDTLVGKAISEVWLNPGADAPEVVARAKSLGFHVVADCSIVDIGVSPSQFPDA